MHGSTLMFRSFKHMTRARGEAFPLPGSGAVASRTAGKRLSAMAALSEAPVRSVLRQRLSQFIRYYSIFDRVCQRIFRLFSAVSRRRRPNNPPNTTLFYTLKRNIVTSPSCMTYSLPSRRKRPFSLAACMLPQAFRSSKATISARMKPRSISL